MQQMGDSAEQIRESINQAGVRNDLNRAFITAIKRVRGRSQMGQTKNAICPMTGKPHKWREPFKRKHNKHVNFKTDTQGRLWYYHVRQCVDCGRFSTSKEFKA